MTHSSLEGGIEEGHGPSSSRGMDSEWSSHDFDASWPEVNRLWRVRGRGGPHFGRATSEHNLDHMVYDEQSQISVGRAPHKIEKVSDEVEEAGTPSQDDSACASRWVSRRQKA